MHGDAKELIELYEQGVLVEGELINKLIELSLRVRPEEYIDNLPENLIKKMKETVKQPPESAKDVFLIKYPTFKSGVDIETAMAKIDQDIYESMWRVHDYLYKY